MDVFLLEALKYAARGWGVTPNYAVTPEGACTCEDKSCKWPGKHSRLHKGEIPDELRRMGTTSEPQIREWWGRWPASNIAVSAGKKSGLVIVDVDPRNDGFASLKKLEAQCRMPFSLTLTCNSGGGGFHFYFAHPRTEEIRTRVGLFPGIDIKGDGGRIVAPPSLHGSRKNYVWANASRVQPLPHSLLSMIQHQKGTGSWQAMRKAKLERPGYGS